MEKDIKICANVYCKKEFTPKEQGHNICDDCWYKAQKKCVKCGAVLWGTPSNWHYCNKCFFKR